MDKGNQSNRHHCCHIKGDVLIDLSLGSMVHHLYAASDFFKHIIVLKLSRAAERIQLDARLLGRASGIPGAVSVRHTGCAGNERRRRADTENGLSDELQDKEGKVRSAVQHVVKCDLQKENMTDPIVLPPADCIISFWLLEAVSKDQEDYIRYLRKFSGLRKPGGHLILFGGLDITYYTVGKDRIRALGYNEEFVRKALAGEGFVIDNCNIKKRTNTSDLTDYKGMIFIAAHREK
ncbi:nicotinamide N-methyltransferase-like [Dendropsophus ebraccatus]|uniref:nicotinamide N-methyltransferase-like n=1 Tax=Dendropsophus ebraccatus TaxID=150705 RepID=UPI003831DBD0